MTVLELVSSVLLLYCSFQPFQNYEQMGRIAIPMLLLWLLSARSNRRMISARMLFYFATILAFYLRATMADGQIAKWFLLEALLQWSIILWFTKRQSARASTASWMIIIGFLSPLHFFVLREFTDSIGLTFWSIVVAHLVLEQISNSKATGAKPLSNPDLLSVLFLLVIGLSVPFAVDKHATIQFLLLNATILLVYLCICNQPKTNLIKNACMVLVCTVALFGLLKLSYGFLDLGIGMIGEGLSMVMNDREIAPLLLILLSIALFLRVQTGSRVARGILTGTIVVLAAMELMTCSRAGWVSSIVFAALLFTSRFRVVQNLPERKKVVFEALLVATIFLAGYTVIPDLSRVTHRYELRFSTASVQIESIPWNSAENPDQQIGSRNSGFLLFCETAGVPVAILFLLVVLKHAIERRSAPELTYGLIAWTLWFLLDNAPFRLISYLHLWLLLGLIRHSQGTAPLWRVERGQLPLIRLAWAGVAVIIFLLAGAIPWIEDSLILRANFHTLIGENSRAVSELAKTRWLAPFDRRPLELSTEIALGRKDAPTATKLLNELIARNDDCARCYQQRAQLELSTNDDGQALNDLFMALRLVPDSGSTHVVLASYYQKHNNQNEVEKHFIEALLAEPDASMSYRLHLLITSINEDHFIAEVSHRVSVDPDAAVSVKHLCYHLLMLGKRSLTERALERILASETNLNPQTVDHLCNLLWKLYIQDKKGHDFKNLMRKASPGMRSLLKARLEIYREDFSEALEALEAATGDYGFRSTADVWEALYTKFGKYDDLRTFWRAMDRQDLTSNDPVWQKKIADSLYEQDRVAEAAQVYHRAAEYNYEDPDPHWKEARTWWLAEKTIRARSANSRLQRVIHSTWFTDNFFRSDLDPEPSWNEMGIDRACLPNELDGWSCRTVILAHAHLKIIFPFDRKFSAITGEVAMPLDRWFSNTGGVTFQFQNQQDVSLFWLPYNPAAHPELRGWFPIHWNSTNGPQTIQLETREGTDLQNDAGMWAIDGKP